MNPKALIGSGDKIGSFVLPFLIVGIISNIVAPFLFEIGGPTPTLKIVSIIVLVPGVIIWLWSVFLIITKVPKHQLITSGPYSIVKHPIYTSVSFLVLPWFGFLLNTWLGAFIGIALYIASKRYAPEEEELLSNNFKEKWSKYQSKVKIPWL